LESTLYQENTCPVTQTNPELDLRFIFGIFCAAGVANPENWVSAVKNQISLMRREGFLKLKTDIREERA